MTPLQQQLQQLHACHEAIEWVGTRTLAEAWRDCGRGDRMAWLAMKLGLDTRRAAADMAERVWHLVEPESQLACAWAIDCARRGAEHDEIAAAWAAAWGAALADGAARAAAWAARAAARAAAWAAGGSIWAAEDAAEAAGAAERRAQANIMRRHFSVAQIERALVDLFVAGKL